MWSCLPSPPSNRSSRKGFCPRVEVLEARCCPSTVRLSGTVLNLTGSPGAGPVSVGGHATDGRLHVIGVAAAAKHAPAARRPHRRRPARRPGW
jgi:hypothetical protein